MHDDLSLYLGHSFDDLFRFYDWLIVVLLVRDQWLYFLRFRLIDWPLSLILNWLGSVFFFRLLFDRFHDRLFFRNFYCWLFHNRSFLFLVRAFLFLN